MVDKSALEREFPPFEFPVERGKIKEFARALGETNPVYYDRDHARAQGFPDVIAPPTFTRNFHHEEPPHAELLRDLSLNNERILHGEQEFIYHKPLVAGQLLTGQTRVAEIREKEGKRGGIMTFIVLETTFKDEAGEVVQVARRTLIETGQVVKD